MHVYTFFQRLFKVISLILSLTLGASVSLSPILGQGALLCVTTNSVFQRPTSFFLSLGLSLSYLR